MIIFRIFLVYVLFCGLSSAQQANDSLVSYKKTAYLLIDSEIDYGCEKYPYSNENTPSSIGKSEYDSKIYFHICRHIFSANMNDTEIINYEDYNKLKLWNFGEMQYQRLLKGYIYFNNCFEKIYFIEKIGVNQYKKYLVTWEPAKNMDRVDLDSKY